MNVSKINKQIKHRYIELNYIAINDYFNDDVYTLKNFCSKVFFVYRHKRNRMISSCFFFTGKKNSYKKEL